MFLMTKQNQILEVLFGCIVDSAFRATMQLSPYAFVLTKSELTDQKTGRELSLREVLDLALDRVLLMSRVGACELVMLLNQKLPPVWPGESPIRFQLEASQESTRYVVTVPIRFHNRLHRFPFDDGFYVCPVPNCTGTPRLLATVHGIQASVGAKSFILENACDAGHHWQCVFCEDAQVTSVSVVRLKRMPDLIQRTR